MPSGYDIPLTEEMAEKLSALPLFSQRVRLEHAINRALDAENWPSTLEEVRELTLSRGELADATPYRYVTVYDRYGDLRGHVGPLTSDELATQCATSWRSTGCRADVLGYPVGPPLTNAY